jgi:hypothetical protein
MYSGLIYFNKPVNSENVDRFWCVLDGNQEMPPVSVETKELPQGEIKEDEFIPIDISRYFRFFNRIDTFRRSLKLSFHLWNKPNFLLVFKL